MRIFRILTCVVTLATAAFADGKVGFTSGDTVASVLARQAGQRVEVSLKSGEKLTGKVEAVGDKVVHLSALGGREFFDAVVVLDDISAVAIRTGGNVAK